MTIDDKLSFQEFSPNNLKQMFVPDNSRRSSSFGSFKIIELKWGIEKTEPLSGLLKSLPSPPVRCSKYLLGLSRTRGKLSLMGAVVPSNWATLTPNNNSILSIE